MPVAAHAVRHLAFPAATDPGVRALAARDPQRRAPVVLAGFLTPDRHPESASVPAPALPMELP